MDQPLPVGLLCVLCMDNGLHMACCLPPHREAKMESSPLSDTFHIDTAYKWS